MEVLNMVGQFISPSRITMEHCAFIYNYQGGKYIEYASEPMQLIILLMLHS